MIFTHDVSGESVGEAMAEDPIEAMYALRAFGRMMRSSDFDEFVQETSFHDIEPIVVVRDLLNRAIDAVTERS